ncbi:hypothetical protein [Bartonella apihabitans]|uniref:hypothetical protein n=1 Tax=Bartonella apihabitans TaxID=2750929 RepID=UPI00122E8151|nr:hypothetical protein [Bartonella apihabitans]
MRATTNKQNLFGKREIICTQGLIIETLLAKTGSWKITSCFLKNPACIFKNSPFSRAIFLKTGSVPCPKYSFQGGGLQLNS